MSVAKIGRGAPVRVLDADPDLSGALPAEEVEEARLSLVASSVVLGRGEWAPEQAGHAGDGNAGVIVVRGLLCREVQTEGAACAELVGPGDLLRPWEGSREDALVPYELRWHVLEDVQLAILGERFMASAARWPGIASALVARSLRRAHSLALSGAISATTGLETRLLLLFWQMADRWGKVRPDGVVIPVQLTHELIGRLIGARRPSVSTALKQLESEGRLARLHQGGWLLAGDAAPPSAASAA